MDHLACNIQFYVFEVSNFRNTNVGGAVAKHIDDNDAPLDPLVSPERFGQGQTHRVGDERPKLIQRYAGSQVRANRGEDVPPVEGCVYLRQPILGLVQVYNANFQACSFGILKHGGDQAVIRHHIVPVAQFRGNRATLRAHARINDRHMHRASREVYRCAPERDRSRPNILGGDFMADVGDVDIRGNPPDDAFHRSDKAVQITKISCKGEGSHASSLAFTRSLVKRFQDPGCYKESCVSFFCHANRS